MRPSTLLLIAVLIVAVASSVGCGPRVVAQALPSQARRDTKTRVDLYRDNHAVIRLYRQVQLHAGSQWLRIALPGRPRATAITSIASSVQIQRWRAVVAVASTAALEATQVTQAFEAIELRLVAARTGRYDVTIAYHTTIANWQADYRIIVQPQTKRAQFDATLLVAAPYGLPAGDLVLHTGNAPPPDKISDRGFAVGHVDIAPGHTRVSLFATRAMPVAPRLTVDFWADQPSLVAATLATDPSYGGAQNRQVDAAVTYDLDFSDRQFRDAPVGNASVYLQAPGQPPVLTTQTRLFDAAVRSHTAGITMHHVAKVFARRQRSEFSYQASANRLVEQFDIDITNVSDAPVTVTLTERAVRGGEWWIGYCNADRVAKSASSDQEFVMIVRVPAHQVRKAMYRIVYSGPQP